jgi:hypothetical protein
MSSIGLATTLQARGFLLRVEAGSLRVTPKSALTSADREVIRAHLPALIACLSPQGVTGARSDLNHEHAVVEACELWDAQEAVRLMTNADAVVNRLGVDGRSPEISQAAVRVVAAYAIRDLETLRFACSEMEVAARRSAGPLTVENHDHGG